MEMNEGRQTHLFHLPIGDYSGDGHGRCRMFVVSSNQPLEVVGAAQQALADATGFNLYGLCDEDEGTIWDSDRDELIALGVDTSLFTPYPNDDEKYMVSASAMATIWLTLLMKTNPDLQLSIISLPILYGKEFVGYGCDTSYLEV